MDPSYTSATDWAAVGLANTSLAIFAISVIVAGLIFLFGHGAIPSLMATWQMPRWTGATRPVFYALAFLVFVFALAMVGLALANALPMIERLYPRWWI